MAVVINYLLPPRLLVLLREAVTFAMDKPALPLLKSPQP